MIDPTVIHFFVKEATIKRSLSDMLEHFNDGSRSAPFHKFKIENAFEKGGLPEAKRVFREMIADRSEDLADVPFKERVKNYKRYKRTGNIGATQGGGWKMKPFPKDDEMITLYTGGDLADMQNLAKTRKGATRMDVTHIRPGSTKRTRLGLFANNKPSQISRYVGSKSGRDKGGALKITVPKKYVVGAGEGARGGSGVDSFGEFMVPNEALRRADIEVMDTQGFFREARKQNAKHRSKSAIKADIKELKNKMRSMNRKGQQQAVVQLQELQSELRSAQKTF